jgi:molybdopterin-containing oxidoreductase family membrane subunit
MSSHYEATIRKPLVIGDKTYHVTVDVAAPVEGKTTNIGGLYFQSLAAFLWGISIFTLYLQELEHGIK